MLVIQRGNSGTTVATIWKVYEMGVYVYHLNSLGVCITGSLLGAHVANHSHQQSLSLADTHLVQWVMRNKM